MWKREAECDETDEEERRKEEKNGGSGTSFCVNRVVLATSVNI